MTVHLNRFSCEAESKLAEVNRRTLQLQTTLQLLEAKLASIPELESVKLETEAKVEAQTATGGQDVGKEPEMGTGGEPDLPNVQPETQYETQSEPQPEPQQVDG